MFSRSFSALQRSKKVPKRATVHATSDARSGKKRFDMREALEKDRQRIEHNKKLDWRSRFEDLKVYPWKFFIAFMVFWSWLGTYAVPYLKGEDQKRYGGTSTLEFVPLKQQKEQQQQRS